MRTLKFYGASDDLFEIEGTVGHEPDEIGCYEQPVVVEIKTGGGAGLRVIGQYAVDGNACWTVGIAPLDEDVPIPDWPIKFELAERGYSPLLTMEVPDNAGVTHHKPK